MTHEIKTPEQHRQRHVALHRALDELVADWITQTGNLPSETSVYDLMQWSHRQTINPDDKNGEFQCQPR